MDPIQALIQQMAQGNQQVQQRMAPGMPPPQGAPPQGMSPGMPIEQIMQLLKSLGGGR